MRSTIIFLLICILCSCGGKRTIDPVDHDQVLVIDLLTEPDSDVKKLSDFAAEIEYIPLETTEASLMGNIRHKIVSRDTRIYIKNIEGLSSSGVLCFDSEGRFIYKLDNAGRGPEEYTSISDFDVSSDNKFLTILSSSDSRLLTYGISDTGFMFQRSVSLGEPKPYRAGIVPETDNVFLAIPPWGGAEPALSIMINIYGDTIHFKPNCNKYEMLRERNYRALNEMLVYSVGEMVCFKEEFSDTVFCVDAGSNSFKPRIIFDSHGTFYTAEMRASPDPPGKNLSWIANIFETSRYVFYWYSSGDKRNRILYDKKTTSKYRLETDNKSRSMLKDDLSGGPDFDIEFLNFYCSNGRLFSFVEAMELKKYVSSEEFETAKAADPEGKSNLRKLADSLKETDNPVLVVVTPKE